MQQQWSEKVNPCVQCMSVSSLLKRVLEITPLALIPAKTLALEVSAHPPLLFHARVFLHVQFAPLAYDRVRLWVKMQIRVRVRMSAQTAAVGTAQEATALLGCCGDVEEVTAQWTLQVLVQTGTNGLNDETHKQKEIMSSRVLHLLKTL